MTYQIEPREVVQLVDCWVSKSLSDAAKYDNSDLLDESGIWSLHAMAASVYALGWDQATRAAEMRQVARHARSKGGPA